jgi:hypothetical protein
VLADSDLEVAAWLKPRLPELLWLLHMGVGLFWAPAGRHGTIPA